MSGDVDFRLLATEGESEIYGAYPSAASPLMLGTVYVDYSACRLLVQGRLRSVERRIESAAHRKFIAAQEASE